MANYVSVSVSLEGEEKNIQLLKKCFKATIKARKLNPKIQFILYDDPPLQSYLCGICLDNIDDGEFSYEARWTPNPLDIIKIVRLFGLSFEMITEIDNRPSVYKYDFQTDDLYVKYITQKEFDECQHCLDDNCNHKNPKQCDLSENWEEMDTILDKKEWNCVSNSYKDFVKIKL